MSFLTICLNPTLQKTLRFASVAPGAVNRAIAHRLDASGKGINVTRVLTQLGKKAVHLTQLGGCLRPLFLSLCEQDGLSVEWTESESQIRFCYTTLTENDNNVTELVEESEPVAAGTEERLLKKFDALLADNNPGFKTLIISGTKAAGFSGEIIPGMVQKAKEKGLRIILDIKGDDLKESLKHEPDIVKPNLLEFASTFTPELIRDNDILPGEKSKELIKSVMAELTQKHRCIIILTNGSRKILAAAKNNFCEIDPEPEIFKTVNTTGCGDAFTAGLASADTEDFIAAIKEGMRCGALNASLLRPGVIR
ncbi:MAG: PfkB family carbohydrate kinase [Treponema sp.]|nr:PfkB family carbohydrate kinase [Treponema sp.]